MLPHSSHAVAIMRTPASHLDTPPNRLLRGTVGGRIDRLFIIDTDEGECRARRTFEEPVTFDKLEQIHLR